jgi:GNAT superfamily N-acetyltransferase
MVPDDGCGRVSFVKIGWTEAEKGREQAADELSNVRRMLSFLFPNIDHCALCNIVFDSDNSTLTMRSEDDELVAACVYTVNPKDATLHVLLVAVTFALQKRGYGRILMTLLRNRAKALQLNYLLTNADHNAINFWKKVGFTGELTLPDDILREHSDLAMSDSVLMQLECGGHKKRAARHTPSHRPAAVTSSGTQTRASSPAARMLASFDHLALRLVQILHFSCLLQRCTSLRRFLTAQRQKPRRRLSLEPCELPRRSDGPNASSVASDSH